MGTSERYHKVVGVEVSGGFLDGLKATFCAELNCLIGGRGTGKTTLLELVRWALDHLPDAADAPTLHRDVERLVKENLRDGRVTVGIETLNGIRYRVERTWGERPIVTNEAGEVVAVELGRGSIFSADIFSQGQLEKIAEDPLFQLTLIDKFNAEKIHELNGEAQSIARSLETNATTIIQLRKDTASLRDQVAELPEIAEKLKTLKGGAGSEEAKALDRETQAKATRDRERAALAALDGVLREIRDGLEGVAAELPSRVAEGFGREILEGANGAFFAEVRADADTAAREAARKIGEAARVLQAAQDRIGVRAGDLETTHGRQQKTYQDLLERFQQERGRAKERDDLLRRQTALLEIRKRLDRATADLEKRQNERTALLRRLSDVRDARFRLRAVVAERISAKLAPTIRVRVEQFGNKAPYRDLLVEAMKGSGVKYAQVVDRIVERVPPADLAAMILQGDPQALMDHAELDADRANRMVLHLRRELAPMFRLESIDIHDLPTIELLDGPDYKDSAALSTGQKCTTILPIVLLESASPLLIDQPEDNLDNAFIYETVVKSIRGVRGQRQLIFVSHNPNIPVLGDAGHVIVLQSTGRRAAVRAAGTVDEVKDDVELLLEGGREAFEQRKKRYGH